MKESLKHLQNYIEYLEARVNELEKRDLQIVSIMLKDNNDKLAVPLCVVDSYETMRGTVLFVARK